MIGDFETRIDPVVNAHNLNVFRDVLEHFIAVLKCFFILSCETLKIEFWCLRVIKFESEILNPMR